MKYCTHCGSELADEAVICPKCGCPTELYSNQYRSAGAPNMPPPPPKQRVYSPLSIIGFVFAFLIPLVGLICSILAFKNAQAEANERCKNFAKAGIIISAILFALEVVADIVYAVLIYMDVPFNYYFSLWSILF